MLDTARQLGNAGHRVAAIVLFLAAEDGGGELLTALNCDPAADVTRLRERLVRVADGEPLPYQEARKT